MKKVSDRILFNLFLIWEDTATRLKPNHMANNSFIQSNHSNNIPFKINDTKEMNEQFACFGVIDSIGNKDVLLNWNLIMN